MLLDAAQVGQPVVRVAQGKLQLGVVVGLEGPSLLVAVVVPSRIAPGTTVDRSQVKCAPWFPSFSAHLSHVACCRRLAACSACSP
jgi:hypothetical protein